MGEKKVEAGAYIYNEGDTADVAYIIVSGKVEIFEIANGSESKIDTIEAGKVFGDLAVFDPSRPVRPYGAKALEATVLNSVSYDEFHQEFQQCPKGIMPLLQLACEKMKATKIKAKTATAETVLEGDIAKITVSPASEKLKATLKPVELPVARLPFRIGGYPESGEVSRRDQLHLAIPAQEGPLRVSRQHCEIGIENKTLVVTDLGSRFGTWVNGVLVGRGRGTYVAPLKKGDNEITLGASDGPYKLTVNCK